MSRNYLSLSGEAIVFNDIPCQGASVTNTDTIQVSGIPEMEGLSVEGRFAPGFAPEPDGEPEIEILIDFRSGINYMGMLGSDGSDYVAIGTLGAAINADGDADIVVTGGVVENLVYSGFRGADVIGARGGNGAGGPAEIDLYLYGHEGNDRILGGLRRDVMGGGEGRDAFVGGNGGDVLFGKGGSDRLVGGKGGDNLFAGRGNDLCRPGPGRDTTDECERPASLSSDS